MRIIDYFNILAAVINAALVLVCLAAALRRRRQRLSVSHAIEIRTRRDDILYAVLVLAVLAFGVFLRFWDLPGLPDGLQQDEASIGYEAYCLANFGIDRNGYPWPVYPITWGSGGGSPLMIYCNVLTTKLFGTRVFSIRFVTAFFGTLTLLLFFLVLLRLYGRKTALTGLFVLTVMPWHIMLSRFSLDSNIAPFFELLAASVMTAAVFSQETRTYCLAAGLYSLCLYTYGSANIVIPLHLVLVCLLLLACHRMTVRQLLLGILAFLAVASLLALFYAVNFLGVPEIVTPYFSFPKFTSSHFGSVFISFGSHPGAVLLQNLRGLMLTLTVGHADEVSWNMMPGYATLYQFTFPVTFYGIALGAVRLVRSCKNRDAWDPEDAGNAVFFTLLVCSMIFALLIEQDINREVFLFLPLVFYHVTGLKGLADGVADTRGMLSRAAVLVPLLLLTAGFGSFAKDYYGGRYNDYASYNFMPGYGDAMVLADRIAADTGGTVWSTYSNVASPFMLTLYYTRTNPKEFLATVHYKDPEAEFRVADRFGHFVFGLPEQEVSHCADEKYARDVFVVTAQEAVDFTESLPEGSGRKAPAYDLTPFGNFVVIRRSYP